VISTAVLSFLLAATPALAVAPPVGGQSTEDVHQACLAAVSNDSAGEEACLKAIRAQAEPMRVDELDPKFKTSCLTIPQMTDSDLIWAYLDWLGEHPDAGPKPASTTINAALLEKIPCGWRQ
jgi:hypothetical protein